MKKRLYLACLLSGFLVFTPQFTFAQATSSQTVITKEHSPETQWVKLDQNNKYGKYFSPERVIVRHSENGIPVLIDAWIKTTYSPEGARITVNAMHLNKHIPRPAELTYSLAHVQVNPQSRTLKYLQEIFYNRAGVPLVTNNYAPPKLKEINSQSFDENFYDAIVDHVFNQGETARAKAKDRWLTLWRRVLPSDTSSASVDTTTIRKRGADLIAWVWSEKRQTTGGSVISISFYKAVYNLNTYNYKIISLNTWTPQTGWENMNKTLTGEYLPIVPDSSEDIAMHVLKAYANEHPDWVNRYQIIPLIQANPKSTNSLAQKQGIHTLPQTTNNFNTNQRHQLTNS